jgi:DNA-binding CsgD family transcriptional regulator
MDATMDEVSDVIRLVREVSDLWDDPSTWRAHLLQGACRLLNGHVGVMMADYRPEQGWFGSLQVISVVGLPAPMEAMYRSAVSQMSQRRFDDVAEEEPDTGVIIEQLRRQGWATVAGNQLADEATRHATPMYLSLHKQIDCDDHVTSIRLVDVPRRPEAISVERPHGAPEFGSREVTLMKLLHDEIAPLIGVRLTTEEHLSRDGLSKRLRETLSFLLEGQSEKQVATSLNLGTRTIHDYVMRLYQHFEVSSRAELLAYFVRRTPVPRSQGDAVTAN